MFVKVVGKKIYESVNKDTGEVKENGLIFFTSKFGNVVNGKSVSEGLETGSTYVAPDVLRQIPLDCQASLDFDRKGYLKNIEVIEGGK